MPSSRTQAPNRPTDGTSRRTFRFTNQAAPPPPPTPAPLAPTPSIQTLVDRGTDAMQTLLAARMPQLASQAIAGPAIGTSTPTTSTQLPAPAPPPPTLAPPPPNLAPPPPTLAPQPPTLAPSPYDDGTYKNLLRKACRGNLNKARCQNGVACHGKQRVHVCQAFKSGGNCPHGGPGIHHRAGIHTFASKSNASGRNSCRWLTNADCGQPGCFVPNGVTVIHTLKTCPSILKNEPCNPANGQQCPRGHDNPTIRRLAEQNGGY